VQAAESVDWSADPWHALTDTLKERTGRKGRALFRPLRLAITGRESGPEMGPLVKLIGKERTLERLTAAAA
jgi:glutamyl-tRNA synthetase